MTKLTLTTIDDPLAGLDGNPDKLLHARREWISLRMKSKGRCDSLRVLLATNSLGCGGAEHQALLLSRYLIELGLHVEHFFYGGDHFYEPHFRERGICSHFLNRNKMGQVKFWPAMVKLFKEKKYDVAHAFTGTANFYVRAGAILARVPVVMGAWQSRTMDTSLRNILPLSILNPFTSAWMINSKANLEALGNLRFMKHRRIFVVPNLIEFNAKTDVGLCLLPDELKQWVNGRTIVGTVGRITAAKNFDLFIDVVKSLTLQRNDVCFWVVGGAEKQPQIKELEKHLHKRVKDENLAQKIRFLGRSDNVPGLLPHMKIFLCTSDREGCPNAVLEAMRARRPIIMTECTDTTLLVGEGKSGHVVPMGNAQAMSKMAGELLDDNEKCIRFGLESRNLLEKNFSARYNAWLLAKIYVDEWIQSQNKH